MKNQDTINTILLNASTVYIRFKKVYMMIIFSFNIVIKSLISYPGGKFKLRDILNEVFGLLSQNNTYNTYIDGFFGMGGSFKALGESLLNHGVKTVIVNDLNPCVITLHKCVRNHPNEMINYFLKTIRTDIVIPHNKLFISVEELLVVKEKLANRFYELQSTKEFGIETSTLLVMLCSFNFSGVVNIKKNGDIRFTNGIYDADDMKNFFFQTIVRIQTFSKLYNQFDMQFYNEDYLNLHKKFKNRANTLWNIDTVYLKENYSDYIEADIKNAKNSDFQGCACDYGQEDFPHIEVLETLNEIDFIYNNNCHPLLKYYIDKFNLDSMDFVRNESINATNQEEVNKVTEKILFKNNFPSSKQSSNSEDYATLKVA